LKFPNEPVSKALGGGLRSAIVDAARRMFLERGFGAVSMDDLTVAAGVAWRTLYSQLASEQEVFRESSSRYPAARELALGLDPGDDAGHVLAQEP
jgi:TetR/AcrR family transcriptional regulator, regulator of autoinduction and epiphytic fitness